MIKRNYSILSLPSTIGPCAAALAVVILSAAMLLPCAGCGVFTARNPDFNTAETGEDGQIYVLDDLRAIANDEDLTQDEKRQAFQDLGIEDQDLINVLLGL